MRRINDQPVFILIATLVDGREYRREWTVSDPIPQGVALNPPWLKVVSRSWPHPQGPLVVRGNVRSGGEDEAIDYMKGGN